MKNFKTVNSYPSRMEAEIAKSFLESNGVNCFTVADDVGGADPYPFANRYGVELKVEDKYLEKAKKILASKLEK